MSAFLYLTWTSARNRFRFQMRRVRSPRYAAALVAGALYVWGFLLRPAARFDGMPALLGQPTAMVVSLLVALTLMGTWLFGSDTTALAFTQAELSMLFPAPLTRRALIGYKLYRAQIAVLINAVIWVFVLRRGGTILPSPLRAVGIWILFSTLNLHRLGAALVRASWREHGTAGARRNTISLGLFALIGAALVAGLFQHRDALMQAQGIGGFFIALGDALAAKPASVGLAPFHLIVAPTFARNSAEWVRAILPAFAVLLVHAVWVFHTDRAFEDAALIASAERAKRLESMRNRRSLAVVGTPRPATSSLRLASKGHPAMAIVWKNLLCLRRTAQLRLFIGPLAMAIALGAAFAGGNGGAAFIATTALTLSGMLLIFGGRLIRNDLRHDMLNLPLLKSLPIQSGDIILAEVAGAALPMAAVQCILVAVAYAASVSSTVDPLGPDMRLALLVASPFAVLALNGALLTIQNGTAVLFPAWIRLGSAVNSGVEALGQNMLATMANMLSLGVALVIPLIVAYVAVLFLGQPRAVALTVLVVLASCILALETYGAMRLLGRALARVEPPSTA